VSRSLVHAYAANKHYRPKMSSVAADEDSKNPQDALNDFWENLITKKPGKVTNIFPSSLYTNLLPPHRKPGPAQGKNAAESYQAAADECRARVKRIVRECRRTNEKVAYC
jgi:hypothetical protein